MFELVPSKLMRKYLREQGREFSDKEKAALIWNAPNRTLSEKLEALGELAHGSSDEALRNQIKERTEYEAVVVKALKDNPNGQSVYVVVEQSEHYSHSCGFFADFDAAFIAAANALTEYFKNETEQNGKAVLDTAKAYAEVCRLAFKHLIKATRADDILF